MVHLMDYLFSYIDWHYVKVLFMATVALCCYNVNALNFVILIIAVCSIWVRRRNKRHAVLLCNLTFMSCLVLGKDAYQTEFVPSFSDTIYNCTELEPVTWPEWIGLENDPNSRGYLIIVVMSAILHIIRLKLVFRRGDFCPENPVTFPGARRVNLDFDIVDALKYAVNYSFYKFGLELCQIGMAMVCYVRRDMFAPVYGVMLLLIIFIRRRNNVRRFWPVFCFVCASAILIQYFLVLGLYPSLCFAYPWETDNTFLRQWLFLPYYGSHLDASLTIGDALLFLLMRQQSIAFDLENRRQWVEEAGSNAPIYQFLDDPFFQNPVPDHTLYECEYHVRFLIGFFLGPKPATSPTLCQRVYYSHGPITPCNTTEAWVDLAKVMVIGGLYWGNLLVSFMAGVGADLLSIGYLVGAFFIIWKGNDLYLRGASDLVKWWRLFCVYTVISIVLKCSLTKISCNHTERTEVLYWVFMVGTGKLCEEGFSFYWEMFVFIFLLFQMRFFQSPYFIHQFNDVKASHKLQSSGAALIRKLLEEKTLRAKEALREIVLRLKEDMENIKDYHQSILNPDASRPITHDQAVLAGDYYMFESDTRFRSLVATRRSSANSRRRTITYAEFVLQKNRKSGSSHAERIAYEKREEEALLAYEAGTPSQSTKNKVESLNKKQKFQRRLLFAVEYLKDVINESFIPFLNKASHNYRLVNWAMKKDKNLLKKKRFLSYNEDMPIVANMEEFEREEEKKNKEQSIFLKFADAVWFALQAHSELLCFIAVFVHQIFLPSLLSLPMPLLVLMWGALTPGNPSQTFWTTLTAYSQITIIVKCLLRNEAFPWRKADISYQVSITYPPSVIGIDQSGVLAFADVLVLIMLFMHRRKLINQGLWTEEQCKNHPQGRDSPSSSSTPLAMTRGPPPLIKDSLAEHFKPIREFFRSFRRETAFPNDVYSFSFLCEFLSFLIIIFGFSSFSPQAASGTEKFYLVENEVPLTYLVTIILQFVVMIVDRIIYLRKNIQAKLMFHLGHVLSAHIWIFLVLPTVTSRRFSDLLLPQVWYGLKYISFLFSTYQLRTGFPLRVGAHFLCGKYNKFHYFLFKGLKFVPFFNFIRSLINWLCFKTSLTIFQWQLLCSMNAVIYETKCQRHMITNSPVPRGEPLSFRTKAISGGWLLVCLLLLPLLPLILFFIVNSFSLPSPPVYASFTIRINTFQDIYFDDFQGSRIQQIDDVEYSNMIAKGQSRAKERLFLDQYSAADVSFMTLSPSSRSAWTISSAQVEEFKSMLKDRKESAYLTISWEFKMKESEANEAKSNGDFERELTYPDRIELLNGLNSSDHKINISGVPLNIENKNGHANSIIFSGRGVFAKTSVELKVISRGEQTWWEIRNENGTGPLKFLVFSSKQVPFPLNYVSAKGILGLYLFVLVYIGLGALKRFYEGMYQTVKYVKLPNPDPVLQLSKDIYLARESEELELEEDLYAKLKFLFRSPETMIKWTRFLEEEFEGLHDEEGIANDIEL